MAGERTRKVKAAKKLRGEHVSGLVPYGYRKVSGKKHGLLEVCPEEMNVIETFIDMHKGVGGRVYSFTEIANWANENGIMPRKSKTWKKANVARIVYEVAKQEEKRIKEMERREQIRDLLS